MGQISNEMPTLDEYYSKREQIIEENTNLVGVILNDEEKRVDAILKKYKELYKKECGDDIKYSIPTLSDDRIIKSKLYSFCKDLPKGSDLHVHGTSLVPIHRLIDFLIENNKLYFNVKNHYLANKKTEDTILFKDAILNKIVDKESLLREWTILNRKQEETPWHFFENLFAYFDAIDADFSVLKDYYIYAFNYYLDIHINHIEIHSIIIPDKKLSFNIINTIKEAYFEVKKKRPELSVSVICASMKQFDSFEETKTILNNAIDAYKIIKDDFNPNDIHNFVIGFDLVNEEDKSRSLKDYAELLINIKKENPDFEYYLHCGESINTENNNLIDAYLLKAERVGHGTNLYRYPSLLKEYVNNEICLESCLISNQRLDYVKDLRLHPSAEYLKRGVTIALCSDDPAYMEYEALVDDYFAAIICWDLGLAEIKHLCINSIMYSGTDSSSKQELMKNWHISWLSFIKKYSQNTL